MLPHAPRAIEGALEQPNFSMGHRLFQTLALLVETPWFNAERFLVNLQHSELMFPLPPFHDHYGAINKTQRG